MLKTTPNKVLLKKNTHDTFAQSQMWVPHRRIQDANGACIPMGLKPVSDGRRVNSNDTSGSRGRGRCGDRRVEGGGVWRGVRLGKVITDVSNRQSYLPCKSAFVNATFEGGKTKQNKKKNIGKKKRQSIAAVSKTPQRQSHPVPTKDARGGGRASVTCSVKFSTI